MTRGIAVYSHVEARDHTHVRLHSLRQRKYIRCHHLSWIRTGKVPRRGNTSGKTVLLRTEKGGPLPRPRSLHLLPPPSRAARAYLEHVSSVRFRHRMFHASRNLHLHLPLVCLPLRGSLSQSQAPHPHLPESIAESPVRLLRRIRIRREDMQDPEREQMLPKKDGGGGGGGVAGSSPLWTLFRAGRVQVTNLRLIQNSIKSSQ